MGLAGGREEAKIKIMIKIMIKIRTNTGTGIRTMTRNGVPESSRGI
jgi:hypothetical protein